ncbi:fimbrial protein [Serratia grimesii]|uniref:fimbrial protein n=1 Tax=Serratia grimesii TaxID=82995 RepID=UPI00383BBC3B
MIARCFFCFFVFLLLAHTVQAENIPNTCWPGPYNNNFSISLFGGTFPTAKAGAEGKFRFKGVPMYNVKCIIKVTPGWSGEITIPIPWFYSKTKLPVSDFGSGYYKVNDDVDIKIYLSPYDFRSSHWVPSNRWVQGGMSDTSLRPLPTGIFTSRGLIGTDKSDNLVMLRLRRDIIGGVLVIPPLVDVIIGYKAYANFGATVSTEANVSISLSGQYLPVPVICSINNGTAMDIDFGDIDSSKLSSDGSSYIRTVALKYNCNASINQHVDVKLIADTANFSSDLIASSMLNDVGLLVKYRGKIIKPNENIRTVLFNGQGQDEIQVAPVKNPQSTMPEGGFTASATLIMTLP